VLHVRKVSQFTNAKAQNGQRTVRYFHELDLVAGKVDKVAKIYLPNIKARHPGIIGKRVGKTLAQFPGHPWQAVDGNIDPLLKAEGANIVQASGMVVVLMGKQYAFDVGYPCAQHLLAEIRPGVDDEMAVTAGQQRARPQPLVAWVAATTSVAFAGDNGNALAGTGAEEGEG
jgi:hypothetical protein